MLCEGFQAVSVRWSVASWPGINARLCGRDITTLRKIECLPPYRLQPGATVLSTSIIGSRLSVKATPTSTSSTLRRSSTTSVTGRSISFWNHPTSSSLDCPSPVVSPSQPNQPPLADLRFSNGQLWARASPIQGSPVCTPQRHLTSIWRSYIRCNCLSNALHIWIKKALIDISI